MKLNRIKIYFYLSLFILQCTTNVKDKPSGQTLQLRQYKNIYVKLISNVGSKSLHSSPDTSMADLHIHNIEDQTFQAVDSLKSKLISIGFTIVDNAEKADALIIFSIGTIRYNDIEGWIADQGAVTFREKNGDSVIAHFKVDTKVKTPAIKEILAKLAKAIRGKY